MLTTPLVLLAAWLAVVAGEASEPAVAVEALAARVDSLSARVDALQAQLQALQAGPPPPPRRCYTAPPLPAQSGASPDPAELEGAGESHEDPANASLHEAAARDDEKAVVALLRRGASLEERDARGDTALHAAARAGAARATSALLRRGAAPGARGALLRTPLHAAAAHGQLESARRLVEAGAPLGARDARGATALALAARHNHSAAFEWLVQRGPAAEWADAAGDSALLAAARAGRWARAEALARGGAAPAARGRDGVSALVLAAGAGAGQEGALAALEAMLRGGALCDAGEVARALAAAAGGAQVWAIAQAAPDEVAGAAGHEAMLQAARDCRVEALAALLAAGVDPALPDGDGRTALQLAVRAGHVACVHALLPPLANYTDILQALYAPNSTELLQALAAVPHAQRGPATGDVLKQSVRDGRCDFALVLMALEANQAELDAAVLLSQKGANATCVEPLLNAVRDSTEKTGIVGRILKKSHNPDVLKAVGKAVPSLVRAVAGEGLLSNALQEGRCNKAGLLLDLGVSADGDDAQQALRLAVNREDLKCVQTLRSRGVAALDGDRWKWKLLEAAREGELEALAVFLTAGVPADAASVMTGRTPLMAGAEAGHENIVLVLLECNAQVNRSDYHGDTALTLSSRNGHVRAVDTLLYYGAEVNKRNKNGITALIYASWYGHSSVVRVLLKAKADVNVSDVEGDTALTLAARSGHLEVVQQLLAAKADVNARNRWGKTALDYASELKLDDIKRELLNARASSK